MCPHSQQGADNGLLRKPDGSTFNATLDRIEDARNSPLLRQIRLDMLAGRWNPACRRCENESHGGLISRNQTETTLWSDRFTVDMAKQLTFDDGQLSNESCPIMHYGVRFGNKCNLKCRMCSPTESNFWYEDYVALWNTHQYDESFGKVTLSRDDTGRLVPDTDGYTWYESPLFWDHISRNAENIQHIHTVGGEPMLIDQQWDFLQRCIDMGISKNIIIEYNSNVVKIPPIAWNLWRHFREVRIGASIDGIGPVNDYIRHPSRWRMIEENLDRIDSSTDINFVVWIASTVMIYNIWYIPDTLEWFMRRKYKRFGFTPNSPLIFFHPLYGPKHLNARTLPPAEKQRVVEHFARRLSELIQLAKELHDDDHARRDELISGITDHLNQWQRFMLAVDQSELMPQFWKFTHRLDKIRSESMRHSLPEFYDVIKDTNQ